MFNNYEICVYDYFVGVIHGKETDVIELMISNGLMETLSIIFSEETDADILVCIALFGDQFYFFGFLFLCYR